MHRCAEAVDLEQGRLSPPRSPVSPAEQAFYLMHGDEQVYYVLHSPAERKRGQVLLPGPFASERPHTYVSWVRWARFLAAHGFEVLRFDYRGTGESTGRFCRMGFVSWLDDLQRCAEWLRRRGDRCPLVLHGLRLGALLASMAFERGVGDAQLLWSPPASARKMLYDTLRRRLATDLALGRTACKTRADYVSELEAGQLVEVEGYLWSKRLWEESAEFTLRPPERDDDRLSPPSRAGRIVYLDRTAGTLYDPYGVVFAPRGGSKQQVLNPNLSGLFADSVEWICGAVGAMAK